MVHCSDPERVIADLERRNVAGVAAGFHRDFSPLPPPPGLPSVRVPAWRADDVLLCLRPHL